jgi:hypothetical protein
MSEHNRNPLITKKVPADDVDRVEGAGDLQRGRPSGESMR